jgi:hypothetical protein
MPRLPGFPSWRWFFVFCLALADCVLLLAYCPSFADSLESLLFVQRSSEPVILPEGTPQAELLWDFPGTNQPATFPADKAALDDDTPVIGVYAAGHARAYLLEAFTHGPGSHLVNDVLGGVPISVTHCDISGCTRVFTDAASGQPLELMIGGFKGSQLVMKVGKQLYFHQKSEPVDKNAEAFPYREYPVDLTAWGEWRHAHPDSDVYMGTVDEATPTESGGPKHYSPSKASPPAHHTS